MVVRAEIRRQRNDRLCQRASAFGRVCDSAARKRQRGASAIYLSRYPSRFRSSINCRLPAVQSPTLPPLTQSARALSLVRNVGFC
jgi:hypothetical protein